MAETNNTVKENKINNGTKTSLKEIFGLHSIRRLLVFPLMAFVFIVIIIIYHSLLMSYARQSILENAELNSSRAAKEIELYLSSATDTIEESAYTIEQMIENGATHDEVLKYMTDETHVLENTTFLDTTGLYACIHDEYHDGSGWDPGPDYIPMERPWYTEAIEGDGRIVLVNPYLDLYSGDIVLTLARSLSDKKSVIAIDVKLGKLAPQKHSHQRDAPAVLGNTFDAPPGGRAVARGVLQAFGNMQDFQIFACVHIGSSLFWNHNHQ